MSLWTHIQILLCFTPQIMKSMGTGCLLMKLLLAVAVVVPVVHGVWFDLPTPGRKCVSEQLNGGIVVVGDYYAFVGEQVEENSTVVPTIAVRVTSPFGNDFHHEENITYGQFAFTTVEGGNYMACFWVHGNHHGGKVVTLGVDWKSGITAKDWDEVAKKEHVEGLEFNLARIEEAVKAVHEKLIDLKNRETMMRAVNDQTNTGLVWYNMVSQGVCIVVAVFQVWYLKHYFRKKKLI